jgi:hypothetical protein
MKENADSDVIDEGCQLSRNGRRVGKSDDDLRVRDSQSGSVHHFDEMCGRLHDIATKCFCSKSEGLNALVGPPRRRRHEECQFPTIRPSLSTFRSASSILHRGTHIDARRALVQHNTTAVINKRPAHSQRRRRRNSATLVSSLRRNIIFLVLALHVLFSTISTTMTTNVPSIIPTAQAWEWSDFVVGGNGDDTHNNSWLSRQEISSMRVRDIKRRLARTHGYGADELARMLDKQELIAALWGEEYREYEKVKAKKQRQVIIEGIWMALIAVVVVVGWPVWKHVYEVAMVNWVVYTDRKWLEIQKCRQYRSFAASIGVLLMLVVDVLQIWLSVSVLLSWVMTSKYFFPMPTLAIRPAQFMGEKVAQGPMGRYGMNVAPMAVTWMLRFLRGKVETHTAQALSNAYQQQKRQVRANETEEEKAARKAARKAAKQAAKEETAQQEQERLQQQAQFRKDMAEQATQQLFGRKEGSRQQQQQQQQQQAPQQSPFEEDQNNDSGNANAEDWLSDEEDELEAKRQFEADLQEVDINDLD